MDILNSDWLIHMLEKSSQTPHGRLLGAFDILEDWCKAPGIHAQLSQQISKKIHAKILQDFLAIEAAKAGAALPEILANQLYFMLISAAQECLQANNHAGFGHAKSAAKALIAAQTKKEFHIAKSSAYAVAASLLAVTIVAGSLFFELKPKQIVLSQPMLQAALMPTSLPANPEQTAALMAQLELMRHGNCQLIEAIQLPDQYKGIYLNMVVNGQVSTDPQEQKIAIELLKKTRCNYTPMLMANSK